jgi:hypothetical protein
MPDPAYHLLRGTREGGSNDATVTKARPSNERTRRFDDVLGPSIHTEAIMAHKDFACKACGAEFDTRDQLDRHNEQQHAKGAQGGSADTGQRGAKGGTEGPRTSRPQDRPE